MENTTIGGQDLMMKKIPRSSSKIFKVLVLFSSKDINFQFTYKFQKKRVGKGKDALLLFFYKRKKERGFLFVKKKTLKETFGNMV